MTLVEVIMAATLATLLLASVLSSFLFIGRTSANLSHYADMETQARDTLEQFAQDVRQASDMTWVSADEVTLTVNSTTITYTFDASAETFTRLVGTSSDTLMSGITSFTFTGYKITGDTISFDASDADSLDLASRETKQLQISLRAERKSTTAALATDSVLSARFILRNKRVTA